jgi:hypothetical protein
MMSKRSTTLESQFSAELAKGGEAAVTDALQVKLKRAQDGVAEVSQSEP